LSSSRFWSRNVIPSRSESGANPASARPRALLRENLRTLVVGVSLGAPDRVVFQFSGHCFVGGSECVGVTLRSLGLVHASPETYRKEVEGRQAWTVGNHGLRCVGVWTVAVLTGTCGVLTFCWLCVALTSADRMLVHIMLVVESLRSGWVTLVRHRGWFYQRDR